MSEARLRREADRLRAEDAKPGDSPASQSRGSSAASGPDREGESAQDRGLERDSEEERKAYERARRRAAREAGFYVHLMWYGIVIGSLLILNLVVSPWYEWCEAGESPGFASSARSRSASRRNLASDISSVLATLCPTSAALCRASWAQRSQSCH
jgi:hypothetical protein